MAKIPALQKLTHMGKWDLVCEIRTRWGPFQQFGRHEDQVHKPELLASLGSLVVRAHADAIHSFSVFMTL